MSNRISETLIAEAAESVARIVGILIEVTTPQGRLLYRTDPDSEPDTVKAGDGAEAFAQTVIHSAVFETEKEAICTVSAKGHAARAEMAVSLLLEQLRLLHETVSGGGTKEAFYLALLTGEAGDGERIRAQAVRWNIPDAVHRVLLIAETEKPPGPDAREMVRALLYARRGDFLLTLSANRFAVIRCLSQDGGDDAAYAFATTLADMLHTEVLLNARVSCSSVVHATEDLPRAFREAQDALRIGTALFARERVFCYTSLGIGKMVFRQTVEDCETFLAETFGEKNPLPLLDEELLMTAETLFSNSLQVAETARKLYVHRNTLLHRLEKIRRLTGLDVRSFDDALTFRMALLATRRLRAEETN